MGFYDPNSIKGCVIDALRKDGWSVEFDGSMAEGGIDLEVSHPELSAADVSARIELQVADPGMPGSWIIAAREAYRAFDESDESYNLWRAGARTGIARAEDLPETLAFAIAARAAGLDADRAKETAQPPLEPARRVIFDDDNYIDTEDFRDVVFDQVEGFDDPSEIPEDVIWREMSELRDVDLQDEISNVDHAVDGHPFIATGTLGLWNGRPPVAFVARDFQDAYRKAMGCDCEYFRAWDENGRLMIAATHHDGTNYFELRALTDAGRDWLGELDADCGLSDADVALLSLDCYSEPPRVAERVYGRPAIEWAEVEHLPTARAAAAAKAAAAGAVSKPAERSSSATIR